MKLPHFLFLFHLISSSAMAQIPRSYGDIHFMLPAAYSMAVFPEGAMLNYTDERNFSYPMFLLGPYTPGNDAQQSFAATWSKLYGNFSKPISGPVPAAAKKKHLKGWDYYEAGANCKHQNGTDFYAILTLHFIGNKMIALGCTAPNENLMGYQMVFVNMVLNSLSMSSNQSVKSGFTKGIAGVWTSVRSAATIDRSVGRAEKWIVFYDDGVFCYEMPDTGLDSIDRAGSEAYKKGYWGTYRFEGKTGTVSFSTYTNEPIQLSNNTLRFFNMDFTKLRSVDGLRFDGLYTSKINSKDWWRGYEPTVRFYKDGRFEDKSALFDVDKSATTTGATQKPGRGKYSCRNFSLILEYDDGRKAQLALYSIDWNNPSSPAFIYAGKDLLKKK